MSQRSSAASGTSSKSSASSSKSSAASGASSKSDASSAASSKSGSQSGSSEAGSSANQSGSKASGTSQSGASSSKADSETTEKSISEIGGGSAISKSVVPDGSEYNQNVASAYAQSARNLDKYSRYGEAGGAKKDPNLEKEASQIKVNASKMAIQSAKGGGGKPTGRKVFVMRHGERMDRLFPEWLTVAITDEGKYRPYDMNQPLTMIERVDGVGWAGYEHDSPITEMGSLSGQMVGRGLKSCKVDVKQVISSPALRCVQTANAILKAMENLDLKICIEPGLFEWLTWYDKIPQWFEPQTLSQTGKYRINEMYKPIMSVADVVTKKNETTKEYGERVANVTKQLMEQYKSPGTTLIVGHGSTMDMVGRSLLGKPMTELSRGEMDQMGVKYPYCAVVAIEEMEGSTWKVVPSALPQLNFLGFSNRFDPDYFNRA